MGFEPLDVDLSAYARRQVTLTLETTAGQTPDATLSYDWAFWLYPELLSDVSSGAR